MQRSFLFGKHFNHILRASGGPQNVSKNIIFNGYILILMTNTDEDSKISRLKKNVKIYYILKL